MKTFLLVIIIVLLNVHSKAQNPGDLNPGFNGTGYYFEDWADTCTRAIGIKILTNGSIILTGGIRLGTGPENIFTTKIDSQGYLVNFGNNSRGFTYDFSDYEMATSLEVLPDNSMFIAGAYMRLFLEYLPFVIKLNSGGEPDEDFADNGVFCDESIPVLPNKIKFYHHGDTYSLILAGTASGIVARMIMLSAGGEIVTGFGTGGKIDLDAPYSNITDVFIDSGNNLLYACGNITGGGAFVAKYNLPDGTPVAGFGVNGVIGFTPAMGYTASFDAMAVDIEENTMTLFGSYPAVINEYDIFAYRLHAGDGSDDESFGIDGISTLRVAGFDESIKSALMQSDGKYYFGGSTDYYGTNDFFIGRINHDGFADMTFGSSGLVITEQGFDERIFDMCLSRDESIIYATGVSDDAGENALAIAAYHTEFETETTVVNISDENIMNSISIFPNPVSEILIIETDVSGPHEIRIFDLTGKKLMTECFSGSSHKMNLEGLEPSIYLIHVSQPGGNSITRKLIVK